eukprot:2394527-Amphidinium_carterae.1
MSLRTRATVSASRQASRGSEAREGVWHTDAARPLPGICTAAGPMPCSRPALKSWTSGCALADAAPKSSAGASCCDELVSPHRPRVSSATRLAVGRKPRSTSSRLPSSNSDSSPCDLPGHIALPTAMPIWPGEAEVASIRADSILLLGGTPGRFAPMPGSRRGLRLTSSQQCLGCSRCRRGAHSSFSRCPIAPTAETPAANAGTSSKCSASLLPLGACAVAAASLGLPICVFSHTAAWLLWDFAKVRREPCFPRDGESAKFASDITHRTCKCVLVPSSSEATRLVAKLSPLAEDRPLANTQEQTILSVMDNRCFPWACEFLIK